MDGILYNLLKSDDIIITGRNLMFFYLAVAKRDFYDQFRR